MEYIGESSRVPLYKLARTYSGKFPRPFLINSVLKMSRKRRSRNGRRKGRREKSYNTRHKSPRLHSNQEITSAGRHSGNKPNHDRREGSNVIHTGVPRSELFHQSRRDTCRTSVLNRRNSADREILGIIYGPPTPIPRRYKDIRNHSYDRTICDLCQQDFVLERKLQKLPKLFDSPDEMEWESSNPPSFVAAPPLNGAFAPSFTDAVSMGGEKMES